MTAASGASGGSTRPGRPAPWVSVNVTPESLIDGRVSSMVRTALAAAGLSPSRLRVEVPETLDATVLDLLRVEIAAMRADGVHVVLDDLGAGSSSLRHVARLRLDGYKVDRSFVVDMVDNPVDAAVVRLLVALAREIGVDCVAEGVETDEQESLLLAAGARFAQGWRYGRPAPLPTA